MLTALLPKPKLASARTWLMLCLFIQALLLANVATQISPNPDEFPNLMAGLSYLKSGQYSLYDVNPPTIKLLAAIHTGSANNALGNRFRRTSLGAVMVPLPQSFVTGIDSQRRDFEQPHRAYRFGQQHESGVWYYYLLAFSNKLPLGAMVMLGIGAWVTLVHAPVPQKCMMLGLPVAVLTLVSSQTEMNDHFRYALAILGQILVLSARGFVAILPKSVSISDLRRQRTSWIAAACLLSIAVAPVRDYPFCHGYANETSISTALTIASFR